MDALTLVHCWVAMNTAHVTALFAGGVGKPLGKLGGALPFRATTTQLGCGTTFLGLPIRVIFTVLASPIACSAAWMSGLTSSHVGARMGGADGVAAGCA